MKLRFCLRHDPTMRLLRVLRLTFANGCRQFTVGLTPRLFQFRSEFGGWILTVCGIRLHSKNTFGGGIFGDWSPPS